MNAKEVVKTAMRKLATTMINVDPREWPPLAQLSCISLSDPLSRRMMLTLRAIKIAHMSHTIGFPIIPTKSM